MLRVSPDEIVYQLPWDLPDTIPDLPDYPLRLFIGSDSPPQLSPLKLSYPRTPPLGPRPVVIEPPGAVREDGTPVSLLNPIHPGEMLRLFLTGYDEPRATHGVPAPNPPAPGIARHDCRWQPELEPQGVQYFGLAPGRIGVYELRFLVPSTIVHTAAEGRLSIICRQGAINLPVAR